MYSLQWHVDRIVPVSQIVFAIVNFGCKLHSILCLCAREVFVLICNDQYAYMHWTLTNCAGSWCVRRQNQRFPQAAPSENSLESAAQEIIAREYHFSIDPLSSELVSLAASRCASECPFRNRCRWACIFSLRARCVLFASARVSDIAHQMFLLAVFRALTSSQRCFLAATKRLELFSRSSRHRQCLPCQRSLD